MSAIGKTKSNILHSLYSSVVSTILDLVKIKGFDVKALRAFRVLRPLRLVSGVPSKYTTAVYIVNVPSLIKYSSNQAEINNHNFYLDEDKVSSS